MTASTIRLGTRRSPLALHQTALVSAAIRASDPRLTVEIVEIVSDGDRDVRELREIGERGIFATALEARLRAADVDAVVHSSKDLPIVINDDDALVLAAWLERADPRDALVGASTSLLELPSGARIATGSARREAALRTLRSDLEIVPIRGNVQTRIERARTRGDDGLLLAMAGLERLELASDSALQVQPLSPQQVVPEAGQGAVVVQARGQVCPRTGFDFTSIDNAATRRAVQLEREITRLLGGGCERPVGVHAQLEQGRILCFAAPRPDAAGVVVHWEAVGLELGTLLSVSTPRDIDDAACWTARRITPSIAAQLGIDIEVEA